MRSVFAVQTRDAVQIISLIDELRLRDGLDVALDGRDESTLEPLVAFIAKYITHPRYSAQLITIADKVFGECMCGAWVRGFLCMRGDGWVGDEGKGGGGARAGPQDCSSPHQREVASRHSRPRVEPSTSPAFCGFHFVVVLVGVRADLYAPLLGRSIDIDRLFLRLQFRIAQEVKLGKQLLALQGGLDLVMAASTLNPATH